MTRAGAPGGGRGRSASVPQAALHWERLYDSGERPWGESPSELARLAVARLRPASRSSAGESAFTLLDVGCGYGRDSRYLAAELRCQVVGIDPSPAAVLAARSVRSHGLAVDYVVDDAVTFAAQAGEAGRYDVVFAGQVYALLGPAGRREFVEALAALTRPRGLLFLSTLSPRDPQHYAVGRPVSGEKRSWIEHIYLHFCTAEELAADFAAFDVLDLEERSYQEDKPDGGVHRHASWFLEGRRR